MAGFYGRVSNSNKASFSFDVTYPSRVVMDTQVASDGVFIGRYVLVEYDDPPITGYLNNGVLYSDEMHTKAITPVVGRVY